MPNDRQGVWSLVAVPALLTLIVTIVRLVGELQGWNPRLFGTSAGGDGSVVGISWLVPVFGMWFGWKLRRTGSMVPLGLAALLYLLAVGVFAGGFWLIQQLGLTSIPEEDKPGEMMGGNYFLMVMALAALVALAAWPRLTATLLLYGVLARLPVIAVTWLAIHNGWDTHYSKLAPNFVATSDVDRFYKLALAQATFWPFAYTPLVGGLFGCLGAALSRSKRG